jgi:hypothetical protein
MGWVTGLEPATFGATVRRSNQLSYTHHKWLGTPGGIRTPDLEIRSLLLYPAELRALISVAGVHFGEETHYWRRLYVSRVPMDLTSWAANANGGLLWRTHRVVCGGAADGTRTRNNQLGRLMLYQLNYGRMLVGPTGFEPATLCSQSRCATKLRYGPT